jgi:hypothetical protein
MAIVVKGVVQGIKTKPAKEFGKQPTVFAGVAWPKKNGYSSELEFIDVKLSQDQITSDFIGKFKALEGKEVEVEVELNSFGANGKVYNTWNCNGEPIALQQVSKLQKVG